MSSDRFFAKAYSLLDKDLTGKPKDEFASLMYQGFIQLGRDVARTLQQQDEIQRQMRDLSHLVQTLSLRK